MPETDFHQPDLGSLRAAAETVELAKAATGLVSAYGHSLADSDALAQRAWHIARSLTEAGLTMHLCVPHHPGYWLGVMCLLPVSAEPAESRGVGMLSRTTYSPLLLGWDRQGTCVGTQQAMNMAIGGIPRAFGNVIPPSGYSGTWLVTGRRVTEVGR